MAIATIDAYRQACEKPSDVRDHLPRFVDMCLELEAKKIIELGTRSGVSTIGWLYGCELTDGHVWSVDVDQAPEFEHERWTFLRGNDLSREIVRALPVDVDVVFIDTSHDYQQTLAELNTYRWKVRAGGKIVLHDTELAHPIGVRAEPLYPVKTAIEEFCHDNLLTWMNHPECYGLGVIDMPEA